MKSPTCLKNIKATLADVLLINKPNSFQKTIVCETGVSDHHMLIPTVLKSTLVKLPPKIERYRNYKKFSEETFLSQIRPNTTTRRNLLVTRCILQIYWNISNLLLKYAPIEIKMVSGNQAPFMMKRKLKK